MRRETKIGIGDVNTNSKRQAGKMIRKRKYHYDSFLVPQSQKAKEKHVLSGLDPESSDHMNKEFISLCSPLKRDPTPLPSICITHSFIQGFSPPPLALQLSK